MASHRTHFVSPVEIGRRLEGRNGGAGSGAPGDTVGRNPREPTWG